MNRIDTTLSDLKSNNKTALIPYITAGDPKPEMTVNLMHSLVEQGADMIELGVPFSDPMADGPVIQKAVERALTHNVSLKDVLSYVVEFRKTDSKTPVILMGYLNPIEAMGSDIFAKAAAKAGVDGVLTVDMPPEESEGYFENLSQAQLNRIFLVSPTTPDGRLNAVSEKGSGFVYYVSLKGVTGSKALDADDVAHHVGHLREKISMPVAIGFGIRNGETAYQMAKLGDAIIVGSALVSLIEQNASADAAVIQKVLSDKMCEFRQAIDKADNE
ncbi:tryptophan synthase subunit alpha [Hydrogenovibrio sp. 3SP14C1]|uniref:tryptophan synthase subunit alpha n=1 Tax=Hydrogenovibrio sp. 3SP14C1 TaxID=3038774 RepID=UPI0024159C8A|nr:tryptophan synthase subunit alpha [Hydrogenovibrio sp. 3SP14C1]MDG4813158.1 tryptophan synthase subunit alpha [Hydrogenovibrio sp. 3SP14C1]